MKRAPRALGCLGLLLLFPGGAASAQPAAAEMTVEFVTPRGAVVRMRIPPGHPLGGSAAFHALTPSAGGGWRRTPAPFDRDRGGALVFEDRAAADETGRVQVFVPLPDAAPGPGADTAFAVRVLPPPGYRVADAFPTLSVDDAESRSAGARLPAPPSLLRFRLLPEEGIALGAAQLVDGSLALLLIGLAVFGARRLFRPADPSGAGPR